MHIFCENSLSCKPQLIKSMVHFAGREAMDIAGFNEKTAEQLFEKLNIKEVSDLYRISVEDLLQLDKFREKKAQNLINAIERSKNCTLDSFIFALGIPNVGKKTAGDLARAFGSLTAIREATQEELLAIPDIGEIVASSIVTYFADEKIKENIDELLALGIKPLQMENEILDNPFKDLSLIHI